MESSKFQVKFAMEPFNVFDDLIIAQQSLPTSKSQTFFPVVDVAQKFHESLEKCRRRRKRPKNMTIKAIENVPITKEQTQYIIKNYRKSQEMQSENYLTNSRYLYDKTLRERYHSESDDVFCARNNRRASELVDQLLLDIYGRSNYGVGHSGRAFDTEYGSSTSFQSFNDKFDEKLQYSRLIVKDEKELNILIGALQERIAYAGSLLVKHLKKREALISKQEKICNVITAHLQAYSAKKSEDTNMRFSPTPIPGDSGFNQWRDAMKMVAKLPGGIPPEFRKKLWLSLAEKHLQSKGVNWAQTEKFCFNEWSNPDDNELGVQIVKDLHRTGCSLFCGAAGQENQALLKRVLLAYARWNKSVGYCQGFNMLAALILQVMDKSESDSVKVMIYLIEGVLPESYFANNLRGLSVDMVVFRDLLKIRLPQLSKHLEALQNDAREGNSYEPPLTNVFTMQWFLTLFCNCLPQSTVLRVWDLIFLEGNEILLRTAIAIWEKLSDRILAVNSADEFYSIMGVLTREMLEFGLVDSNTLIKSIVSIGACVELNEMRDRYMYNITPWTQSVQSAARKGFKLFYSDDDDVESDYDEKAAVTAAYGMPVGRKKGSGNVIQPYAHGHPDRERLALDISALKKQYAKLRERQRQAHIILQAACARQPIGQTATPSPIAMNHLLLGKNAILTSRGRRLGPPKGSIPPVRTKDKEIKKKNPEGETIQWKDTAKIRYPRRQSVDSKETYMPESESSSYSDDDDTSSTSTELCDEEAEDKLSDLEHDGRSEGNASKKEKKEMDTLQTVKNIKNSINGTVSEVTQKEDNLRKITPGILVDNEQISEEISDNKTDDIKLEETDIDKTQYECKKDDNFEPIEEETFLQKHLMISTTEKEEPDEENNDANFNHHLNSLVTLKHNIHDIKTPPLLDNLSAEIYRCSLPDDNFEQLKTEDSTIKSVADNKLFSPILDKSKGSPNCETFDYSLNNKIFKSPKKTQPHSSTALNVERSSTSSKTEELIDLPTKTEELRKIQSSKYSDSDSPDLNQENLEDLKDSGPTSDFETFLQERVKILKKTSTENFLIEKTTHILKSSEEKLRRHKSCEESTRRYDKAPISKQKSFDISALVLKEAPLWKPQHIAEETPEEKTSEFNISMDLSFKISGEKKERTLGETTREKSAKFGDSTKFLLEEKPKTATEESARKQSSKFDTVKFSFEVSPEETQNNVMKETQDNSSTFSHSPKFSSEISPEKKQEDIIKKTPEKSPSKFYQSTKFSFQKSPEENKEDLVRTSGGNSSEFSPKTKFSFKVSPEKKQESIVKVTPEKSPSKFSFEMSPREKQEDVEETSEDRASKFSPKTKFSFKISPEEKQEGIIQKTPQKSPSKSSRSAKFSFETSREEKQKETSKDNASKFSPKAKFSFKISPEEKQEGIKKIPEKSPSKLSQSKKFSFEISPEEKQKGTSENSASKFSPSKKLSFKISPEDKQEVTLKEIPEKKQEDQREAKKVENIIIDVKLVEDSTAAKEESKEKIRKQPSIVLLQVEDKRLEAGRRNSERALKIIQENSLILHRILLHQSRSSEKEDSEEESSRSPVSKTFLRSESLISKDDTDRSSRNEDDDFESGAESFSVSPALLEEDFDRNVPNLDSDDTVSEFKEEIGEMDAKPVVIQDFRDDNGKYSSNLLSSSSTNVSDNIHSLSFSSCVSKRDFSAQEDTFLDDSKKRETFHSQGHEDLSSVPKIAGYKEWMHEEKSEARYDIFHSGHYKDEDSFIFSSPKRQKQTENIEDTTGKCRDDKHESSEEFKEKGAETSTLRFDVNNEEKRTAAENLALRFGTDKEERRSTAENSALRFDDKKTAAAENSALRFGTDKEERRSIAENSALRFDDKKTAAAENSALHFGIGNEDRRTVAESLALRFDEEKRTVAENSAFRLNNEEKSILNFSKGTSEVRQSKHQSYDYRLDNQENEEKGNNIPPFAHFDPISTSLREKQDINISEDKKSNLKHGRYIEDSEKSRLSEEFIFNLPIKCNYSPEDERSNNTGNKYKEDREETSDATNFEKRCNSAGNKYKKDREETSDPVTNFGDRSEEKFMLSFLTEKANCGAAEDTQNKCRKDKLHKDNEENRETDDSTFLSGFTDKFLSSFSKEREFCDALETKGRRDEGSKCQYIGREDEESRKAESSSVSISRETESTSVSTSRFRNKSEDDFMQNFLKDKAYLFEDSRRKFSSEDSREEIRDRSSSPKFGGSEFSDYKYKSRSDYTKSMGATAEERETSYYRGRLIDDSPLLPEAKELQSSVKSGGKKEFATKYEEALSFKKDCNLGGSSPKLGSKLPDFGGEPSRMFRPEEPSPAVDSKYSTLSLSPEYSSPSYKRQFSFERASSGKISPLDLDKKGKSFDLDFRLSEEKTVDNNVVYSSSANDSSAHSYRYFAPSSSQISKNNLTISFDFKSAKSSSPVRDYSPETSPPKHLSCLQFTSFQTDIPCMSKSNPICSQTKRDDDNSPTDPSPSKKSTKNLSTFTLPTLSPPRRAAKSPFSPEKSFNPFPVQPTTRQPKEVGVRLGLYKDLSPLKSPTK